MLGAWIADCGSTIGTTPPSMPDADDNPFFQESPLLHGMPQFDRIRFEHFRPAFLESMERQLEEIDGIARQREAPTFENTIVAMERSGRLLSRVAPVFDNLNSAHTDPLMQELEQEVAPLLAAHRDVIFLNAALFARLDALYHRRADLGLDAESRRLLERYHTDFVRAGARLLSRGGSDDAMEIYRAFAGRDPEIGPLLDRRGLRSTEGVEAP
jgi:peptidyl-dipeptidase Dcp